MGVFGCRCYGETAKDSKNHHFLFVAEDSLDPLLVAVEEARAKLADERTARAQSQAELESEISAAEVKKMQRVYAENRLLMVDLIEKSAYLNLDREPEGAFYCFPSFRFDMGSVDLATSLLEECHVATVPGVAFGNCGEGFLRLSYATDEKEIKEAMGRMETFFQNLERENG